MIFKVPSNPSRSMNRSDEKSTEFIAIQGKRNTNKWNNYLFSFSIEVTFNTTCRFLDCTFKQSNNEMIYTAIIQNENYISKYQHKLAPSTTQKKEQTLF